MYRTNASAYTQRLQEILMRYGVLAKIRTHPDDRIYIERKSVVITVCYQDVHTQQASVHVTYKTDPVSRSRFRYTFSVVGDEEEIHLSSV